MINVAVRSPAHRETHLRNTRTPQRQNMHVMSDTRHKQVCSQRPSARTEAFCNARLMSDPKNSHARVCYMGGCDSLLLAIGQAGNTSLQNTVVGKTRKARAQARLRNLQGINGAAQMGFTTHCMHCVAKVERHSSCPRQEARGSRHMLTVVPASPGAGHLRSTHDS